MVLPYLYGAPTERKEIKVPLEVETKKYGNGTPRARVVKSRPAHLLHNIRYLKIRKYRIKRINLQHQIF